MGFSDFEKSLPSGSTPSGRSYALGASGPSSSKPTGSGFQSALTRAQAVEESRARYEQATLPKPASTAASGSGQKVEAAGKRVETPRTTVTAEEYANRPRRARDVLGPISTSSPPVVYNDPFGPYFYLWLLDRCPAEQRAAWAYHHRAQIADARWADMVGRDTQLESRVKQLEAENRPRDPNYVPAPLKDAPDLMYSDEYLAAALSPTFREPEQRRGFPWGTVVAGVVSLALACLVIWLVFIKRFPGSAPRSLGDRGSQSMPTLYQILKNKLFGKPEAKPPGESAVYNPLSIQCGSFVAVDAIDFRGKNFRVVEIQEYDHAVGGKQFKLVNYVLRFDEEVVRLRAVPSEDRAKVMLLTRYDDLAYNEGLHNVVRDTTRKFVVDDPAAGLHEEYWRVEDVQESYKASVTILREGGGDAPPEVSHAQLEYWDYWRDTELDGVKATQYLYVEMNTESGWFQIWRGMETDPERILVT